ncbi:hypothetical protein Pla100_21750 [Neorhodopirellula pilleata]|uniref:Uncharacterized protein n=1 Tax=Neorhodopirellula pilleata TaxID=2714738 RepID=A0A5C6AID4_9BACT|nr:hypothetical protein Pla100_21750 [Neorhodopirellula pilleata]
MFCKSIHWAKLEPTIAELFGLRKSFFEKWQAGGSRGATEAIRPMREHGVWIRGPHADAWGYMLSRLRRWKRARTNVFEILTDRFAMTERQRFAVQDRFGLVAELLVLVRV